MVFSTFFRHRLPITIAAMVVVHGCFGWLQAREALDLDGTWQYQKVTQLSFPPPASGWLSTTVPGYLSGEPYEKAWFRREFNLPAGWTGGRMKLQFGGVKYASQVWVNGVMTGGCTNGYNPYELDVTAALLPGQVNTVLVGLTDWTGLFLAPVDFSNLAPGEGLRDRAKDVVLAPIGGHYGLYGLWEGVRLERRPEVSIVNVFVLPSVSDHQLTVRVRVANETASAVSLRLSNEVLDGGAGGLVLPDLVVALPAGATNDLEVSAAWAGARCWSTDDPFLQELVTRLAIGGVAGDEVRTRFGFRDFRVSGEWLRLNGTNVHLRATSCWPPVQPMSRDQIRQVLEDVKAGNNNAFRLHTQPWPEAWYEVADEVGLLIVEEAAVWCDPRAYRLNDPRFWANYAEHLRAAVLRDRNHPSIIMWSLENEILHCGGDTLSASAVQQLALLGLLVKGLDPTRPITYEADLDPGGVADVLGLHYPHEFPDFVSWPDTAYWMGSSIARSWMPGGRWTWDRSKPLYIGEFLWVPDTASQAFTILAGDPAYADPRTQRNAAKALTWRMQIEAYRHYGVSAMCPWTMFEDPAASGSPIALHASSNLLYQAQAAAYHPNAVFVREYDNRFFTSETVQRTLAIFNDSPTGAEFTLRWGINGVGASRVLSLEAAGRSQETVSVDVPSAAGPFGIALELWRGPDLVYSNELACEAFLRTPLQLPPGVRLGLYDPSNTTASCLESLGLRWTSVTNLLADEYRDFSILVVGRNALQADTVPVVGASTVLERWRQFGNRGGWVLVMEQAAYPGWMPLTLASTTEPTHFAFPVGGHPVTEGLDPAQFRWWRPGHRVADRALRVPTTGNFQVLAHVGSAQGLEQALMLEWRWGHGGGLVCSQARLVEASETEPMARILWQRMLAYCASATPARLAPAGLLSETDSAASQMLQQAGFLAQNLDGSALTNLARFPAVLVAGGAGVWDQAQGQLPELTRYVEEGGTLWLHRPPEAFLTASTSLLAGLQWESGLALPVLRQDAASPPQWITTHDLYWVDDAGSWNRPEVLATNIAARAYRMPFGLTNYTLLQAEAMPIKTVGTAIAEGWNLFANGFLAQPITAETGGLYQFGVLARGSSALGIGPQITLRIDGIRQDVARVTNTVGWQMYALAAQLTAGPHLLALSFENDAYNPPNEDRNLFLDQVRFGPAGGVGFVEMLTRPGVLAEVRRGSGHVLLDEVQWEMPGAHVGKAGRVLSALATRANIRLQPLNGVRLEAEGMQPSGFPAPGLVATNGGLVWYYANGQLATQVRVSAGGRFVFDIAGLGVPAAGVYPRVDLRVDAALRGSVVMSNATVVARRVITSLSAGLHTVSLVYANDAVVNGEDRNLAIDYVQVEPEPVPEILRAALEPATGAFELTWSAVPGRTYALYGTSMLPITSWALLHSNVVSGTAGCWADDGSVAGEPPASAARPQGFYRLQLVP